MGRITVALDAECERILQKLSRELEISYSAVVRRALKLLAEAPKKEQVEEWCRLLGGGEHVILDLEHLLLLLEHVGEEFYKERKKVSQSHAKQLSGIGVEEYLRRLEACNLFRLSKAAGNYTLILPSPSLKRFIGAVVSETLQGMGYRVSLEEDMMKIRLRVDTAQGKP
ncbi:MAG: hypothetical protein QXW77_01240 [Candidatus Hadarchaeales archaeon]